jgi:membrane protein YdbS with pleckstrin-like domain
LGVVDIRDMGFQSRWLPKSNPVLRALVLSIGMAVFKLSLGADSPWLMLVGSVVLSMLVVVELGSGSIMLRLKLVELRALGSKDHSFASASNSL